MWIFFFILIFNSRIITMVFILGNNQRHTTGVFLEGNAINYDMFTWIMWLLKRHTTGVFLEGNTINYDMFTWIIWLLNRHYPCWLTIVTWLFYNHYLCEMTCWVQLTQVNFNIQTNAKCEWLVFNAKSAIFQLYHSKNKLHFYEMMSTLY